MIVAGVALVWVPVAALAQAPPSPATPQAQAAPQNPDRTTGRCAPTDVNPRDGTVTPRGRTTGQAQSLDEKLARSDGVLCPPAGVDPEMHAPTPPGGAMPVIPPPGGPGGDPSVRPK